MTQSKIAAIAFLSSLLGLAAAPAYSSGQVVKKGVPADACGAIIDVNRTTGLVTARVNVTGATYSFRVNDAATLAALQVGNVISAPSAGAPGNPGHQPIDDYQYSRLPRVFSAASRQH